MTLELRGKTGHRATLDLLESEVLKENLVKVAREGNQGLRVPKVTSVIWARREVWERSGQSEPLDQRALEELSDMRVLLGVWACRAIQVYQDMRVTKDLKVQLDPRDQRVQRVNRGMMGRWRVQPVHRVSEVPLESGETGVSQETQDMWVSKVLMVYVENLELLDCLAILVHVEHKALRDPKENRVRRVNRVSRESVAAEDHRVLLGCQVLEVLWDEKDERVFLVQMDLLERMEAEEHLAIREMMESSVCLVNLVHLEKLASSVYQAHRGHSVQRVSEVSLVTPALQEREDLREEWVFLDLRETGDLKANLVTSGNPAFQECWECLDQRGLLETLDQRGFWDPKDPKATWAEVV